MWIDDAGTIVISQDALWLIVAAVIVLIFFGPFFGRPYRDRDDDEK